MPKKKSKHFHLFSKRPTLILALTALLVGGWLTYKTMSSPLGINELSVFDDSGATMVTSKEGMVCTQIAGQCLAQDGQCVTFTDGCQQGTLCAKPYQPCTDRVVPPRPVTTPPPNCVSWFDGCNTCNVKDGVILRCTRMACKTQGGESPKCLSYSDSKPTPPPVTTPPPNCVSWFDGCNTCQVKDGVIMGCTKMACKTLMASPPKCLAYSDSQRTPTPIPTSIPTPSPVSSSDPTVYGIANFQAANPCGTTGFYNYTAQCTNGSKKDFSSSSCTPLALALSNAETFCKTRLRLL